MKTKYYSKNKDDPIRSWNLPDLNYLRNYDNAQKPPQTQIFSYSEPEDEEPIVETTTEICPQCQSYDLKPIQKTGTKYCRSCSYIEKPTSADKQPLQDSPMFIPTAQKQWPPTYNEDDSTVPFFASIDVNAADQQQDNADIELVRESGNGRIKYYKCRDGGQAAALSAMAAVENRS